MHEQAVMQLPLTHHTEPSTTVFPHQNCAITIICTPYLFTLTSLSLAASTSWGTPLFCLKTSRASGLSLMRHDRASRALVRQLASSSCSSCSSLGMAPPSMNHCNHADTCQQLGSLHEPPQPCTHLSAARSFLPPSQTTATMQTLVAPLQDAVQQCRPRFWLILSGSLFQPRHNPFTFCGRCP